MSRTPALCAGGVMERRGARGRGGALHRAHSRGSNKRAARSSRTAFTMRYSELAAS